MFYLTTHSTHFIYGYMASGHCKVETKQSKTILLLFNTETETEMFYLTMHLTYFIYGYMASDIWLRTILIAKEETSCATWATLYD